MVDVAQGILVAEVAVLLGGFLYAAVSDLRTREVTDRLWQVLGVAGILLGLVAVVPYGGVATVIWLMVGGLTIQHFFAWDDHLGERWEGAANLIEGTAYAVVSLVVLVAAIHWGIGSGGVAWSSIALLATVLFARGLFEGGLLYGGADAKALMAAGLLLPTFSAVLLPIASTFQVLLEIVPFSVNLLMNAALISIVIPIGIALRNVARHEFHLRGGFTGYMLPVDDLPRRFVWLHDPLRSGGRERQQLETAEDDQKERERAAAYFKAQGVGRVWVTPQIPFLVLMAAGAVAALLAGNLILDLVALV